MPSSPVRGDGVLANGAFSIRLEPLVTAVFVKAVKTRENRPRLALFKIFQTDQALAGILWQWLVSHGMGRQAAYLVFVGPHVFRPVSKGVQELLVIHRINVVVPVPHLFDGSQLLIESSEHSYSFAKHKIPVAYHCIVVATHCSVTVHVFNLPIRHKVHFILGIIPTSTSASIRMGPGIVAVSRSRSIRSTGSRYIAQTAIDSGIFDCSCRNRRSGVSAISVVTVVVATAPGSRRISSFRATRPTPPRRDIWSSVIIAPIRCLAYLWLGRSIVVLKNFVKQGAAHGPCSSSFQGSTEDVSSLYPIASHPDRSSKQCATANVAEGRRLLLLSCGLCASVCFSCCGRVPLQLDLVVDILTRVASGIRIFVDKSTSWTTPLILGHCCIHGFVSCWHLSVLLLFLVVTICQIDCSGTSTSTSANTSQIHGSH